MARASGSEKDHSLMAELKLTGRTVRASSNLEVLVEEIAGSIDASTARTFENALRQVVDAGHRNVVFVFTNVQYINSTGMGALIQAADKIRAAGGEISLVNVSPTVLSLFEMLGLLPILPVYSTEEEAIAFLAEKAGKSQTTVTDGEPQESPPAPASPAPPAPTPEGAAPAPPPPETEAGPAEAEESSDLYPLELACPDCEKALEIGEQGYYRCQGCGCYFVAAEDGNVQAVRLDDSKVVEVRLPGEETMGGGVRKMAASLLDGLGYPDEIAAGIDKCVEGAWRWAVQPGAGGGKRLFLFLAANPDEWVAGITIPPGGSTETAGVDELKTLADQVDLTPIPTGGHVLRLSIKVWGEEGS